jgi:hypothetical protein
MAHQPISPTSYNSCPIDPVIDLTNLLSLASSTEHQAQPTVKLLKIFDGSWAVLWYILSSINLMPTSTLTLLLVAFRRA